MMWIMVDERKGPRASVMVDRSEGFGERLLGSLLDRAHRMPPHLIATLIEQEIAVIGGRDVEVLLQEEPLSAYFIGSQVCGVMFHPVDARGRQVPTSHNQESLMKVMAISIHTIGLSRQEALSA